MSVEQAVPVLIPLLFIVILELSRIARGIDLANTASGTGWMVPNTEDAPGLGPFTVIHGFNYLLLMYLFAGIANLYQGNLFLTLLSQQIRSVYFLLGLFTLVIWLILPILEVSEYQQIPKPAGWSPVPHSLVFHFLITLVNATLVLLALPIKQEFMKIERSSVIAFIEEYFATAISHIGLSVLSLASAAVISITILLAIIGFVSHIENEISKQSNQRRLDEF